MWDHWLLDTLSSWQKQAEASYTIELDDEREPSPPTRTEQESRTRQAMEELYAASAAPAAEEQMTQREEEGGLPPRKRPRPELGVNGASLPGAVNAFMQPVPSIASA